MFRRLLRLEQENLVSMLDALNLIEKRRIFHSACEWNLLREIRNSFSHDYPESSLQRIEALNLAWDNSQRLLSILDRLIAYSSSIGLQVSV